MADKSSIEWTDATWNIITGCTLVDEGCRNCYAAHLIASWPAIGNHPSRKGLARKNAAGGAKFTGEVRFNEQWLDQPLRWKNPRRIFVCAHGDLFHDAVPDEWVDRVFAVMALAPQHTFQVLTKRPERARDYLQYSARWAAVLPTEILARGTEAAKRDHWPLPNVWLGTSASDQASADLRIPPLLAAPAAVRFLSAEPLLGPIDLNHIKMFDRAIEGGGHEMGWDSALNGKRYDLWAGEDVSGYPRLDWVIVGGESGTRARPMHPDWARSLRDQCNAAGVPFFFKQWGEWAPGDSIETGPLGCFNDAGRWVHPVDKAWASAGRQKMRRSGKARAGRLLDGRTWDQMPGVADGH